MCFTSNFKYFLRSIFRVRACCWNETGNYRTNTIARDRRTRRTSGRLNERRRLNRKWAFRLLSGYATVQRVRLRTESGAAWNCFSSCPRSSDDYLYSDRLSTNCRLNNKYEPRLRKVPSDDWFLYNAVHRVSWEQWRNDVYKILDETEKERRKIELWFCQDSVE